MARDGLLPSYLGRLDRQTKEPYRAQVVTGFFCFFLAVFLDIEKLSELVSMGTLFAFTIVNLSVLILRHRDFLEDHKHWKSEDSDSPMSETNEGLSVVYGARSFWPHVSIFSVLVLVSSVLFRYEHIIPACIFGVLAVIPMVFINIYFYIQNKIHNERTHRINNAPQKTQSENESKNGEKSTDRSEKLFTDEEQVELEQLEHEKEEIKKQQQHHHHHHAHTPSVHIHARKEFFKTPLTPTTPLLGMGINIFLLCQTLAVTWLFFSLWMGVAVLIYFAYGYHHSKEKDAHLQPEVPEILSGDEGVLSSSFSYDYSMDFNSSEEELAN